MSLYKGLLAYLVFLESLGVVCGDLLRDQRIALQALLTSDKRIQHVEGDAYYTSQTVVAFFKDLPLVKIALLYSSYNIANNRFFNSLRENDFEAQHKFSFRQKLWKGLGAPAIDVSVKKLKTVCQCMDSKFSEFWRVGVVVKW